MSRSFVRREETSGRGAVGLARGRRRRGLSAAVANTVEALENRQMLAGNITGIVGPTIGDTNLTTEGNLDWIHLGYPDTATKTHTRNGTANPRISGINAVGGATFAPYDTTGKTFTWTNATPPTPIDVTSPSDVMVRVDGTDDGDGAAGDPPAAEQHPNMFDNTTNKYLNFRDLNSGAIITPAAASVVNSIRIYTANDAEERDPASYRLEGSNNGGTTWTQIATGNLALPAGRNPTGQALNPATQFNQQVNFTNTTSYTMYRVTFPTLKNAGTANSMQVGEVELLTQPPPENAAATTDAASVATSGQGFSFTVPAVADPRKLRVYVGQDGGQGVLTATVSDGTAAPFTATLVDDDPNGAKYAVYELTFQSGLNNEQTLNVSYVSQGGTAIFSGASWIEYAPPAAARNLKAAAVTSSTITVTWNQRAFTENSEVLQMSSDNGATWVTQRTTGTILNPNLTQPLQTVTISNLLPSKTYMFRVQDINLAGTTTSTPISVTTAQAPPGSLVVTPTVPASGDSNLSNEGNLDWVHWGFQGPQVVSRRAAAAFNPRISNLQIIPPTGGTAATPTGVSTAGKTFTWTGAQWFGDVTSPTDTIVGSSTNHPGAENPPRMFDNTTSKYLNFDKLNTGATVTLAGNAAVVGGIRLYTANDDVRRDPASYTIEGSNDGGATWTMISSGPLNLPAGRNGGGQALDPNTQFQQTVQFANSTAYKTYRVLFPTVKDNAANSMQIGEVELLAPQTNQSVTATSDAIAIPDGQTFRFTVPATRSDRRLRVYVGADGGSGVLTASISDNSFAPYTATLVDDDPAGAKYAVYDIVFRAGQNDSQTMTIDYKAVGGSAILSGVSWQEFALPNTPTGLVLTPTGRGKVNLQWTDTSFNESGFRIERSTTADGSSGWTVVTTTGANVTQALDSGLADNTQYYYRVSSVAATGSSPTAVLGVKTADLSDTTTGIRGSYYNSDRGTTPTVYFDEFYRVISRIDPNIAFNWTNSSPDNNQYLQVDKYSVQWDGYYIADYTGPTTFFTDTDDGGRFFIDLNGNGRYDYNAAAAGTATPNGELVVNSYVDQGLGIDGVNNGRGIVVNLVAGQKYLIRQQMYENGGGSAAFLYVQTAVSGGQVLVPQTNLVPTPPSIPKVLGPVKVDQRLPDSATYTSAQHIAIQFSENLRNRPDILNGIVVRSSNGATTYTGAQLGWTFDSPSMTGIITFPGAANGELANGNWTVTLTASYFQDTDTPPIDEFGNDLPGNFLDGDNNGTAGGNFVGNFYVLKGDTQASYSGASNPDRKIDFTDYQRLELNFGKGAADRVSAADGDLDHNGVVNDLDLAYLRAHMNQTQPAEPVVVAATSAPVTVASKPAPVTTTKPTPKPAPKPAPVKAGKKVTPVLPPKASVFANKKIAALKDLLA